MPDDWEFPSLYKSSYVAEVAGAFVLEAREAVKTYAENHVNPVTGKKFTAGEVREILTAMVQRNEEAANPEMQKIAEELSAEIDSKIRANFELPSNFPMALVLESVNPVVAFSPVSNFQIASITAAEKDISTMAALEAEEPDNPQKGLNTSWLANVLEVLREMKATLQELQCEKSEMTKRKRMASMDDRLGQLEIQKMKRHEKPKEKYIPVITELGKLMEWILTPVTEMGKLFPKDLRWLGEAIGAALMIGACVIAAVLFAPAAVAMVAVVATSIFAGQLIMEGFAALFEECGMSKEAAFWLAMAVVLVLTIGFSWAAAPSTAGAAAGAGAAAATAGVALTATTTTAVAATTTAASTTAAAAAAANAANAARAAMLAAQASANAAASSAAAAVGTAKATAQTAATAAQAAADAAQIAAAQAASMAAIANTTGISLQAATAAAAAAQASAAAAQGFAAAAAAQAAIAAGAATATVTATTAAQAASTAAEKASVSAKTAADLATKTGDAATLAPEVAKATAETAKCTQEVATQTLKVAKEIPSEATKLTTAAKEAQNAANLTMDAADSLAANTGSFVSRQTAKMKTYLRKQYEAVTNYKQQLKQLSTEADDAAQQLKNAKALPKDGTSAMPKDKALKMADSKVARAQQELKSARIFQSKKQAALDDAVKEYQAITRQPAGNVQVKNADIVDDAQRAADLANSKVVAHVDKFTSKLQMVQSVSEFSNAMVDASKLMAQAEYEKAVGKLQILIDMLTEIIAAMEKMVDQLSNDTTFMKMASDTQETYDNILTNMSQSTQKLFQA